MSRSTKVWKHIREFFVTAAVIGVILIAIVVVFFAIERRERKLYTVNDHDFSFTVFYKPGGGATGGNSFLRVAVSGRQWRDQTILSVEAADSLEITMPDSDQVKIVVLVPHYIDMSRFYWVRPDSIVIDLSNELKHVPVL